MKTPSSVIRGAPPARQAGRVAQYLVAAVASLVGLALFVAVAWWAFAPPAPGDDGRQAFEHQPETLAHQLWTELEKQQTGLQTQRDQMKAIIEQLRTQEKQP